MSYFDKTLDLGFWANDMEEYEFVGARGWITVVECPIPKMHILKPNVQYDGIRRWGF